jgi:intracellular septation protein
MQALTGLAPLLAFFVAYALRGLYAATAVLMVAMLLLLGLDWLRERRIPPLHALSTVLVLIFGAATLLLHKRIFIQWKATLFLWLLSGAFLASAWVGERTLAERCLAPALESWRTVSASLWRRANAWSVAFYAALGCANLAVAYMASERAWVYFKVFGLALLTFVFLVTQLLWLSARAQAAPAEPVP